MTPVVFALLFLAACPPAPPVSWGGLAAGLRPANFRVTLTLAEGGGAANLERVKARVETAGGLVSNSFVEGDRFLVEGWVEGGLDHLRRLLRPGRVTLHAVDEGGMRAAARAGLPAGARAEEGERVRIFCRDCKALRGALATPKGAWLTAAPADGESEAFLVAPAALDDSHIDRCSVETKTEPWGRQIHLRLTPDGTARFAALTRANVHRRVAVVVDGEVRNAPVVQEPITGGALAISFGGGADAEDRDLLALLRHGPLPEIRDLGVVSTR
jgi:hypothetical protein